MKQKEPKKRNTATALGCVLVLLLIWIGMGLLFGSDGGGTGYHYAGPVLPMTSLNGAEGIGVERNVDFDFSPYETPGEYSNRGKGAAGITDSYILTNNTGEARTVELAYGFLGNFIDQPEEFPAITVDGGTISPALYSSVDPDSQVFYADRFETCAKVLDEGDFLAQAIAQPELADLPVKVYHFTGLAYNGTELASDPMLSITYSVKESGTVWTYFADSCSDDSKAGTQTILFRVDRGEAWILAAEGELKNLSIGGNKGYNLYDGSALENVEYTLETYDTTLGSALSRFAQVYDFWALEGNEGYPNPGFLTPELLLDGAIKQIGELGWTEPSGEVRSMGNLFYQVVTQNRMLYWVFPVEIPAGGTVTVETAYIQEPSTDTAGPREYRESYDMATRLGSNLNFTGLTSSVSNVRCIAIGEQNFGFDLDAGITAVTLDPSQERYYMEIYLREE